MFVIGPDKKVKLILVYPMTTGRNFDEVLRVIDSLQLTAKHKVATPVNWQQGEKVIIAGSVSNDQAKEIYPDGWEEPRPYIRLVPQPCGLRPGPGAGPARVSHCGGAPASRRRSPSRGRCSELRQAAARAAQRGRAAVSGVSLQPLQQVLEDARRGAPDEVAVDDVGVGLERDAAAFDLGPGTRRAHAAPAAAPAPRPPRVLRAATRRPPGSSPTNGWIT